MTKHPRAVHVEQALEDVSAMVAERAARKHLTLNLRVQSGVPLIAIDEATFKKICYNLVECAITFAPLAGEIVLTAGPIPNPRRTDGQSIAFVVAENGPAVGEDDPERRERGYDQLDGGRDGAPHTQAGRLLASTRKLVEGLGGRLWVQSGPERGNALTFVLPVISPRG